MVVAYLRVSTEKQQLENQRHEIEIFAKARNLHIDLWKEEVVSGAVDEEIRVLGKILKKLNVGDTLIVSEISRLSRTLIDIMIIMNSCLKKDIKVYCIKENFVLSNTINSKILIFAFGITAEVERNLISARTKEALARKKAEGVILGRPPGSGVKSKILKEQEEKIRYLLEIRTPKIAIAREFGVSRPTLYKFLRELN